MSDYRILVGDVLEQLATLPDGSVDCVVTSPPYWGLRDYGVPGQIGLEDTPERYVETIVGVFREVRRVLADHGTCWVNLGSSFASGGTNPSLSHQPVHAPAYDSDGIEPQDSQIPDSACCDLCDECLADYLNHRDRTAGTPPPLALAAQPLGPTGRDSALADSGPASPDASLRAVRESTTLQSWRRLRGECSRCDSRASALSVARSSTSGVLASSHNSWLNYTFKPKDMVPTPWLVALALQADGWWLRSDIIWAKPNPMPESVSDRPTKAHEYVFLLTKQARYWYDADAVREPHAEKTLTHRGGGKAGGNPESQDALGKVASGNWGAWARPRVIDPVGRNLRSVWTIPTYAYPEAHFATYPPALVERCVRAGCPRWVCRECGKPQERIVEASGGTIGESWHNHDGDHGRGQRGGDDGTNVAAAGWRTYQRHDRGFTDCGHANYRPGVVLDPFLGSGTTAVVALREHRDAIGIELNPEYVRLAEKRLSRWWDEPAPQPEHNENQLGLFGATA